MVPAPSRLRVREFDDDDPLGLRFALEQLNRPTPYHETAAKPRDAGPGKRAVRLIRGGVGHPNICDDIGGHGNPPDRARCGDYAVLARCKFISAPTFRAPACKRPEACATESFPRRLFARPARPGCDHDPLPPAPVPPPPPPARVALFEEHRNSARSTIPRRLAATLTRTPMRAVLPPTPRALASALPSAPRYPPPRRRPASCLLSGSGTASPARRQTAVSRHLGQRAAARLGRQAALPRRLLQPGSTLPHHVRLRAGLFPRPFPRRARARMPAPSSLAWTLRAASPKENPGPGRSATAWYRDPDMIFPRRTSLLDAASGSRGQGGNPPPRDAGRLSRCRRTSL